MKEYNYKSPYDIDNWEDALDLLDRWYDKDRDRLCTAEEAHYAVDHCILCRMAGLESRDAGCGSCLWMKYEGRDCPSFSGHVRQYPDIYPGLAEKAQERIRRWKALLKEEEV